MKKDYNKYLLKWKDAIPESSTLIVGIDISHLNHDACFGTRDQVIRRKFTFLNNLEGFQRFEGTFIHIVQKFGIKKVLIGLEPTSVYWYPLFEYLKNQKWTVCLVDPVSVYNNRKTMKKDRGKTDPKCAYAIYDLMSQRKFFFPVSASKKQFCGKLYMKNWMNIQRSLISCQNRIRTSLSLIFPEFETVMSEATNSNVLKFLAEFSSPASITCLSQNDFIDRNKNIVRKWNQAKLINIYQMAQNTVGISTYYDNGTVIIKETVKELQRLIQEEAKWFKRCFELINKMPEYENLKEIKGLGDKIITGLMNSIGDYNSFKNAKQITKLAGLNLMEKLSGTSVHGASHISHHGNFALRYWAYHGAIHVVSYPGPFKELYERKKKNSPRGGSGKRSLIAVSDKLLRVVWAIMKKGEKYQFNYDEKVKMKYQ